MYSPYQGKILDVLGNQKNYTNCLNHTLSTLPAFSVPVTLHSLVSLTLSQFAPPAHDLHSLTLFLLPGKLSFYSTIVNFLYSGQRSFFLRSFFWLFSLNLVSLLPATIKLSSFTNYTYVSLQLFCSLINVGLHYKKISLMRLGILPLFLKLYPSFCEVNSEIHSNPSKKY